MPIREPPKDEGIWRRAWHDTRRLRDHWLLTLLGALGAGAIAWAADVFALTNFGQWQAAVIGASAFFVVSFT